MLLEIRKFQAFFSYFRLSFQLSLSSVAMFVLTIEIGKNHVFGCVLGFLPATNIG